MKWPPLRAACAAAPAAALLYLCSSAPLFAKQSPPPGSNPAKTSGPDRRMSRGDYVARQALTYRGAPYRFGGTNPRTGIDCSGLTQHVYRQWGMMLPRTSVEQFHRGKPVRKADLRPGDLVFFKNTYRRGISHVGIYVGDGKFVHAAGRRKGVIVSPLNAPHYANRLAGARRIALDKEPVRPAAASDEPEPEIDTTVSTRPEAGGGSAAALPTPQR